MFVLHSHLIQIVEYRHGSKSFKIKKYSKLQVDRWLRSMDLDEKGFLTEENFEEGVRRTFFYFLKNIFHFFYFGIFFRFGGLGSTRTFMYGFLLRTHCCDIWDWIHSSQLSKKKVKVCEFRIKLKPLDDERRFLT